MDVTSFTGPTKEAVKSSQIEERNVHAVQPIGDRKESASSYTPAGSVLSLEVRDHPLQLLLRVVIEKLNETHPHDDKHENLHGILELELTPEETARHIVTHATSLLNPYKTSRQTGDDSTLLRDFMDSLITGIEQGFDEAQEILQNLGVLHGEVERNIDSTYALVQNNLIEFRNSYTT